jgi:dTDP-glucose 4,6-dehydratase
MPQRILVTGGCGFIGSHFIARLFASRTDTFVVNLDAMYYVARETNVPESIRQSDRYVFVRGNIADADLVRHLFDSYTIDTVVHFAAQSHVQDSFTNPGKYVEDNIVGTHTLLEVSRQYGKLELFVHISTDEVYGESLLSSQESQKTEQSILCPTNPYAATKASAELLAASYFHSFGLPIVITRGNNVYGPNQYPEKLIPRFIDLLKRGEPLTIQGNGTQVRGFLHVVDVARAVECILERKQIGDVYNGEGEIYNGEIYNGEIYNGEIYNIGCDPEEEYTVLDIAQRLIDLRREFLNEIHDFVTVVPSIVYVEDRPFNDKRYFISNEKLKALGWNATISFADGLKELAWNSWL